LFSSPVSPSTIKKAITTQITVALPGLVLMNNHQSSSHFIGVIATGVCKGGTKEVARKTVSIGDATGSSVRPEDEG
jgi:hypothetical protein